MYWSLTECPDLSENVFYQWRDMLRERTGIQLTDNQRQFLQSQLTIRMREIGEEDFLNYLSFVCDKTGDSQLEWSILLDRLVIKETHFFRHQASFDFVCEQLQKKIIQYDTLDKSIEQSGKEEVPHISFDVWSLGCSTGEEAYSLAMLVNEALELSKSDAYFSVLGTDVSRVAVSVARSACYAKRKMAFVPPSLRYKYFTERNGDYKFEHELKESMCFSCANVLHTSEMPGLDFDVIYCQNMLVYFEQSLRHSLLDQIVKKLKPGGVLILGLGEVTDWRNDSVNRIARTNVQAYIKHSDTIKE